jgi:molybdopterin converting factor small subunit
MIAVTVEIWLGLGRELGRDFESISEIRSRKKEFVVEGTRIQDLLESLSRRYPLVAEKIFSPKDKVAYPDIVIHYNDHVISPHVVLKEIVKEGDKITILPVYAGG